MHSFLSRTFVTLSCVILLMIGFADATPSGITMLDDSEVEGSDGNTPYLWMPVGFPATLNLTRFYVLDEEGGDPPEITVDEPYEIRNDTLLYVANLSTPCDLVEVTFATEHVKDILICNHSAIPHLNGSVGSLRLGEHKVVEIRYPNETITGVRQTVTSDITLFHENCSLPLRSTDILEPAEDEYESDGNRTYKICVCACSHDPSRYNLLEEILVGATGDHIADLSVTQPIVAYFPDESPLVAYVSGDPLVVNENVSDTFDTRKYQVTLLTDDTSKGTVSVSSVTGGFPISYSAQSPGNDSFGVQVYPLGHPELHTNTTIVHVQTLAIPSSAPTVTVTLQSESPVNAVVEKAAELKTTISGGGASTLFRLVVNQNPAIGYFFLPKWTPAVYQGLDIEGSSSIDDSLVQSEDEQDEEDEDSGGAMLEFPIHSSLTITGTKSILSMFLGNLSYVGVAADTTTVSFKMYLGSEDEIEEQTEEEPIAHTSTIVKVAASQNGDSDEPLLLSTPAGIIAIVAGTVGAIVPITLFVFCALRRYCQNVDKRKSQRTNGLV